MMKKSNLLVMSLMLLALTAAARNFCSENRIAGAGRSIAARTTIASPLLNDYDVRYINLSLTLSNQNTSVAGFGETKATVVNPSGLTTYAFELDSALVIDSAFVNGVSRTAGSISRDLRAISGLNIPNGSLFTVRIYYHGSTPSGTTFFTRGMVHTVLSTGTAITFTLSDPYLAKDWWPCKQSLTDKIDSADLNFRVPNGTMAGSNGLVKQTVAVGGGLTEYQWKTRYPIEYYLVSASVAPYISHTQMVHFTGSSDSMPVQHFIYDTASFNPQYGAAIDSTPYMVDYLSRLYGRYPFWKEKYGHCIAPLGGGMEHQTMTTLGAYQTPLIAHELGHQWWGDYVTYTSWLDIWMSEGWASYTEQLYVEHFHGATAARAYRANVFGGVMTQPGGSVYVDDTTNVNRIFDGRLTYYKGAAVAHMLRYIAPSDSVFFSGLRSYLQRYAFRTATTDSFRVVMEAAYGRKLDTFFNEWIYGQGFPSYSGTWNQKGNDVFIQLTQTTSVPSSVPIFAMPVQLLLKSTSGDTTVTVYMNSGQQLYHLSWASPMSGFIVDPTDQIVDRRGLISNDPALGIGAINKNGLTVFPNPSSSSWQVSGIARGSNLRIIDSGGRCVWQRDNAPQSLDISNTSLPAGVYTLQVQNGSSKPQSYRLEKL